VENIRCKLKSAVSEPSINTKVFPKSGTLPPEGVVRRKAGRNRGAVFHVESFISSP